MKFLTTSVKWALNLLLFRCPWLFVSLWTCSKIWLIWSSESLLPAFCAVFLMCLTGHLTTFSAFIAALVLVQVGSNSKVSIVDFKTVKKKLAWNRIKLNKQNWKYLSAFLNCWKQFHPPSMLCMRNGVWLLLRLSRRNQHGSGTAAERIWGAAAARGWVAAEGEGTDWAIQVCFNGEALRPEKGRAWAVGEGGGAFGGEDSDAGPQPHRHRRSSKIQNVIALHGAVLVQDSSDPCQSSTGTYSTEIKHSDGPAAGRGKPEFSAHSSGPLCGHGLPYSMPRWLDAWVPTSTTSVARVTTVARVTQRMNALYRSQNTLSKQICLTERVKLKYSMQLT